MQDVGEERPAPAGLRDMGAKLIISVLGPNEEQALPRFLPYAPRFNLRPARKGLPLWTLPLIAAVAALLVLLPVAGVVRMLTDQTVEAIADTARKSEMRLKEDAQYEAARKRLKQVLGEKEALDNVAGGGLRWSVLLDRIREQLPPGVRITLVQAAANGKVVIEGECRDIRSLGAFMVYLRAYRDQAGRSFFRRPQLFYSERRKLSAEEGGRTFYKFQMTTRVPSASLLDPADEAEGGSSSGSELGKGGDGAYSEATVSLPANPITPRATGLEGNKLLLEEAKKALLTE